MLMWYFVARISNIFDLNLGHVRFDKYDAVYCAQCLMALNKQAVSFIDATVAKEICGIALKRREHYFSFDVTTYREWMRQSDVWLKPGDMDGQSDGDNTDDGDDGEDHVFTFSPRFHSKTAKSENVNDEHNDIHSSKEDNTTDICTESKGCFHPNQVSFDDSVSSGAGSGCMCDTGVSENEPDNTTDCPSIPIQKTHDTLSRCKSKCKRVKTSENVKTKKAGTVLPLSGILDHRDFRRSPVSLGHCSLFGEGAAVYHSDEQRTSICEACYTRLLREWNRGEGVV